ncbi:glycosyltransferase [Mucilaginibacter sp. UR6-1]|uniref:glycosyltransferase family 2 protein n=1 Tax=Mucilaginibacter sp. UR6-1 TaxID=1435643 RepID=UPI001E650355|nr:glycosyltransferase [Mucilaginibacter sp. UR6-1]MCC8408378.1 glycosyltransferase [Mucilaginibacter sp. UR6-1]
MEKVDNITQSPQGISVVIPNYNGKVLLQKNLPSIYNALRKIGCTFEIIVADDASTDDSISFLNEHYPDIITTTDTDNKGFSTNINRGIKQANLELVLLLNSDVSIDENYFEHQLVLFEQPDTFGTMGCIIDEANGNISESCKYPLSSVYKINKIRNVDIKNVHHIYTFYLSGANALVNRDKLMQLGGFNELFSPYYHEDLDLSLRAWQNSWKCYYVPASVCRHEVSSTIKSHNSRKKIKTISTRNKLTLHYLHLGSGLKMLWAFATFVALFYKWITGQVYFYTSVKLFTGLLPDIRVYKAAFTKQAIANNRYMDYRQCKKNIKASIDAVLNRN